MGVPKFFRYISERYPCLSETIKEYQMPEFDYLYLDMNGIIHACSHPNDSDVHFRISEDTIFKNIFHYVEVLFNMIRPQKLFFMAIDGVAPRAKINQQRSRRFRSAKEAEMQEAKAKAQNIKMPEDKRFDSNCITPGTFFMAELARRLNCFIVHKISTDDTWKKCKVLFSGSEVPGEGEHKIMDFIRYMKASEDYNINSRHCLYGLDADLIMLGLCSHEPNFSLLREEVKFGKKQKRIQTPEEMKFCLLHLSLLREYIDHEFSSVKDKISFPYDIEKIIDDWVLMGFLVGNDFIPHLPNLHIANGALTILYRVYMEILPTFEGYINEVGTLNLNRFEKFMERLSRLDLKQFNEHYADLKYFESKTGRKPNETERHVYEKFEDEEVASPKKIQNKDLDALIKSTAEMSLGHSDEDDELDIMDDESDSDIYHMEFVQHKRDYYMSKLEYKDIDAEFLRSQAEGYVRAIQWNLHYYYNGCCSWSWYYPHHYAPYISDIKDFKDLKLEFELGIPFTPFEQLLAVLPPYSKELLPVAFQSLLVEKDSPIINYYPNDFKTDLNGKRQEWEAVVLIPFINEKLLIAAMQPHLSKLTPEEQQRNTHGKMRLYSFTDDEMGIHEETSHFPEVDNHVYVSLISDDDIFVPKQRLVKGLSPGYDINVYYPGFPKLHYIDHRASLKKAEVKVFQQPSRGENMILYVMSKQIARLEDLAPQLLGKSVYVDWPYLKEALVVGVANNNTKFTLIDSLVGYSHDNVNKENIKGQLVAEWSMQEKHIRETYMSRLGISIGHTDVLVYVRLFLGNKYVFGTQGEVTLQKQWAKSAVPYVYQTIVKDISIYYKNPPVYKTMHDIFVPETVCFMLGYPYYGAMGKVLPNKTDDTKSRRIQISVTFTREPTLEITKQAHAQQKTRYMHGSIAAQRLGISSHLLSRITGTIYVVQASNELDITKHNIGLNLKFNKKNEEVPGYTKKENSQWLYSIKAIELIRNYMTKCPNLFERLTVNVTNDIFQDEELFDKESNELESVVSWLKTELHDIESRTCGVEAIDAEVVQKLEEELEEYLNTDINESKAVIMQVKPHLLFKPALHLRNVAPDPNSQHRLLDRICCVRNGFTVPIGTKGTIIGMQKANNNPAETMFDVLFDRPFIGGLSVIGCSESRGYRLAITDFMNISYGERMEHGNPMNEPSENWRQMTPSTSSPKRNIRQSPKVSPQMRLAKKGLEKLNQDILSQLESNKKITTPCETSSQKSQNASSSQSEFQTLWNELHSLQKPSVPPQLPSKQISSSSMVKMNQDANNRNAQSDPSAFLKAMLKIADGDEQTSDKQQSNQSTEQSTATSQKTTAEKNRTSDPPPPLVQQWFDHARRAEEKEEKTNPIWYCSQLLRHFSCNSIGMPKYVYTFDDKTGLISCQILLQNASFRGEPCTTHGQAAESAAKKAYKTLNLDKISTPETKMIPAPRQQWYNGQQNSSWVQNIRPPVMSMCPPKMPPIPQNLNMQPNLFYPNWNQKLPPNPGFSQTVSYSQYRQQLGRPPPLHSTTPVLNQPTVEVRQSTAFVPLQAQKKNRNTNVKQISKEMSPSVKKNLNPNMQQQKKEEAQKLSLKDEVAEAIYKIKKELHEPKVSQQPQNAAAKTSKPRKSRVAAKFGTQTLSNGNEPQ